MLTRVLKSTVRGKKSQIKKKKPWVQGPKTLLYTYDKAIKTRPSLLLKTQAED